MRLLGIDDSDEIGRIRVNGEPTVESDEATAAAFGDLDQISVVHLLMAEGALINGRCRSRR